MAELLQLLIIVDDEIEMAVSLEATTILAINPDILREVHVRQASILQDLNSHSRIIAKWLASLRIIFHMNKLEEFPYHQVV